MLSSCVYCLSALLLLLLVINSGFCYVQSFCFDVKCVFRDANKHSLILSCALAHRVYVCMVYEIDDLLSFFAFLNCTADDAAAATFIYTYMHDSLQMVSVMQFRGCRLWNRNDFRCEIESTWNNQNRVHII